jgi:hypothetical protein
MIVRRASVRAAPVSRVALQTQIARTRPCHAPSVTAANRWRVTPPRAVRFIPSVEWAAVNAALAPLTPLATRACA